MKEPLSIDDAKREILRRLRVGEVRRMEHFERECRKDGVLPLAAQSLLTAGFVEFSEFEGSEWRYRVRNGRAVVVVSFGAADRLNLVTFFLKRR